MCCVHGQSAIFIKRNRHVAGINNARNAIEIVVIDSGKLLLKDSKCDSVFHEGELSVLAVCVDIELSKAACEFIP